MMDMMCLIFKIRYPFFSTHYTDLQKSHDVTTFEGHKAIFCYCSFWK